jgi:hypothetical protein
LELTMKKWLCLLLVAWPGLLASPGASAENAVSDKEAQSIARDAYVYSYAMMENYQTWRKQAVDKTANEYVGGFNVFRHYSEPFTRKLPALQPSLGGGSGASAFRQHRSGHR